MLGFPSISMAEIRRLYRPGEFRHWFDEDTMRFFGTRLPGQGVRTQWGNFFITYEVPPSGRGAFSLRCQNLVTGDIETVGKFCSHPSMAEARRALQAHLTELMHREEQACD